MHLPIVTRILAIVPLALALGTALPVARTSAAAMPTTLHVIEHDVHDIEINVGGAKDDKYVGDQDVFADPLYASNNKTRVGHDQGVCFRTVVGQAWECFTTFFLPGGQVTVESPYYDTQDSVGAITGGTGKYVLARGQVRLHARDKEGSEYDYFFTFYTS